MKTYSNIKNKILIVLLAITFFSFNLLADEPGYKSIFDVNKELGRGINLGNGFEDNGYGSAGHPFNVDSAKNFIDKIATITQVAGPENKFDHIRIPVRWDCCDRTLAQAPYTIDPTFLSEVTTAVDYALDKGLKVVLNVHHYDTLYASAGTTVYAAQKARFFAIWTQICAQFGSYSNDLVFEILNEPRDPMTYDIWNALIPEALSVIRNSGGNNATRPVMIGSSNWGGFPPLDKLKIPAGDENLIVTVHIYNPGYLCSHGWSSVNPNADLEWWDMQNERNLIQSFFSVADRFQNKYPNIPIHVGEFGVYNRADTDSRALWIAYVRDALEKRGYSWCYWEFRAGYGIYDVKTQQYNLPIVKALFSNQVPKRSADHSIVGKNVVYDQKTAPISDWKNRDTGSSNAALIKTYTKGYGWSLANDRLSLAQNKNTTYRVSFKASVSQEGFNYITSAHRMGSSWNTLAEMMFTPGTEEREFSYTFAMLSPANFNPSNPGAEPTQNVQIGINLNDLLEDEGVTVVLTIRDFKIEEVEKRQETAPVPLLADSEVQNLYSSKYTNTAALTFTGTGNKTLVKDNSSEEGKDIIQIANFSNQTISFPPVALTDKKTLHLNVYAGSQMDGVTVSVTGDGGVATASFDLPSHEWQHLGINLENLTSVSSIAISGGTGTGRKMFLDHIFLQAGNVPENTEKIPAAPTPAQTSENVNTIYSTQYGVDEAWGITDIENQTTMLDTNGNDVLQLNSFSSQLLEYTDTEENHILDLGNKNHFHIDFYPEERFQFSVKLISYKDGIDNPATNLELSTTPAFCNPGEWNSINMDIEDFLAQTGGNISAIQLISDKETDGDYTIYLDHIYFYYAAVQDDKAPGIPPYIPPVIADENLLSVFSNHYNTSVTPDFSYTPVTLNVQGEDIWRFRNTTDFYVSFENALDVSGMTHLHIDVWTKTAEDFTIYLNENEYSVSKSTLDDEWLRLDIPLSAFPNNPASVNKIGIAGTAPLSYYIGNLYFYKDEQPFTPSPIATVNSNLGKGINLGELLDTTDTSWSIDDFETAINNIASLGDSNNKFGHLRLPVDWINGNRSMAVSPYNISPAFIIDSIKPIVDYALEQNLKLIVTLPANEDIAWQIADYFRYYPEELVFETEDNDALAAVRELSEGRAVIIKKDITETDNLPTDDHIIASVDYKGDELSVWFDTQEERDVVNNALSKLASLTVPVYIGAFGTPDALDMDSRVLWTTYTARYFEENGYSWAYWNFIGDYGIYKEDGSFETPLVNALLIYPMPDAAEFDGKPAMILYDSNSDEEIEDWSVLNPNGYLLTNDIFFEDGTIHIDLFPMIVEEKAFPLQREDLLLELEEGVQYKASFKQTKLEGDEVKYIIAIGDFDNGQYFESSALSPSEDGVCSVEFKAVSGANSKFYIYIEGLNEWGTYSIFLKDIAIERVAGVNLIKAAPVPTIEPTDVISVFSTEYGEFEGVSYPTGVQETIVSEEQDGNGNFIKLFSDFDEQAIVLTTSITPADKKMLHLEAYAGSPLNLTVSLSGSITKELNYSLPAHEWTSLDIDLSSVLESTSAISSITLSGGTGTGRKVYLDHIYFYKKINEGQIVAAWTGAVDNDWNNPGNWSTGKIPSADTDVYILGKNTTNHPYLTGNKEDNACRNIYILQGGEIGRQDLLTYHRAHVQLNWGLRASEQATTSSAENLTYQEEPDAQLTGSALEEHLKFSAGNSTIVGGNKFNDEQEPSNGRERWVLLTAPLNGMYSGDISFGGYPNTYMQQIRVENKTAQWSNPFASANVPLNAGIGFALFVREGNAAGALGYREDDGAGHGLKYTNGIVEFPYYENTEMSAAHRIHQYDADTKKTSFYRVYKEDYTISNQKEIATRNGEPDYRFIMENPDGSQKTSVKITGQALDTGSEVLIGNPYVSTIDFEKLVQQNPILGSYYRIWTGSGYKSYSFTIDNSTGDLNKYIAPMQSFLVVLNEAAGESGLTLNYDISELSVLPDVYPVLQSKKAGTGNPMLTIKAANSQYSSEALVVMDDHFDAAYKPSEDVYKLFTNIANVPEVYTVTDQTAIEINCTAFRDDMSIPLGLKTSMLGEMVFTLYNMNDFDDKQIFLVDKYLNRKIDITGMTEYEYPFENLVTGEQNDRFELQFTEENAIPTSLDNEAASGYITVYPTASGIRVLSSVADMIKTVSIYNMQGGLIYHKDNIGQADWEIDLPGTNSFYVVSVATEKSFIHTKVNK